MLRSADKYEFTVWGARFDRLNDYRAAVQIVGGGIDVVQKKLNRFMAAV